MVGMTASQVRDSIIEFAGEVPAPWEVSRVTVDGVPGFRVRNFQATGNEPWTPLVFARGSGSEMLLEPGSQVTIDGLVFSACSTGTCNPTAFGSVPTVSTWGLGIMGLLVLAAGTVGILRRNRAAG